MNKRTRLIAIILLVLAFGYLGVSVYVLETLTPRNLVQMRILKYDSEAEPVIFPMPGSFKDGYWKLRGRSRVGAASKDPSLQKFAADLETYLREVGEQVDAEHVAELRLLLSTPVHK